MSKGLEALEALERITKLLSLLLLTGECPTIDDSALGKDLNTIENTLIDYEKKTKLAKEYADVNNVAKRLKALEIIKEKKVDVHLFCACASFKRNGLEKYNDNANFRNMKHLTKEEYDLLKEVLL